MQLKFKQGKIRAVKCEKKTIKSAILRVFSAIIELVRELAISNMQNKFEQEK